MLRDIDDVTEKPETSSVRALESVPVQQIANVQTAVPNILGEQPAFVSMVNNDLTFGYRNAVDAMVVTAITGATPALSSPGANLLEGARNGVETIAAAGYSADVIALSPADAAALDLLQSSGSEAIYQFATSARAVNVAPLWGLSMRVVVGLTDPLVLDSRAVGAVHLSPVRFGRFEENAGATNTSTYRVEGTGAFALERIDAATEIAGS